jgi:hypothetical protein
MKFLRILECLNYLDLIQINAKEIRKGYCAPWAGFYLAQLLGPFRPGLAAPQQIRGGRGIMVCGGTGRIRWLTGGQGGRGGAQEHEEAMGN